jgi:hypothetical protein
MNEQNDEVVTETPRDQLLTFLGELHDHAVALLPSNNEAIIDEHFNYLHWPDHDVYAKCVTFLDSPNSSLRSAVLAAVSLDELRDYSLRVAERARAIGYQMKVPEGMQLSYFRGVDPGASETDDS